MSKNRAKRAEREQSASVDAGKQDAGGKRPEGAEPRLGAPAAGSGHRRLLTRYEGNPLLRGRDWPYTVNTVFNAGAVRLATGETVLLCRVEERTGLSHLAAARSKDGVTGWVIDREPTFAPSPERHPEESWGVEDPRLVWVPELEKYAVTYTSYSSGGPAVSLAFTEDFRTFERLGAIMPPEDKDAALMPVRFGAYWALIHRPTTGAGSHIWVSYSPDLRHWGSHRVMLAARRGPWWDAVRIGLGPPVIHTEEGWLMIYHGVRQTAGGALYRVGLALFDLETPERCLLRGDEWIFGPEEAYECIGDTHGVVFPCGYTLDNDGDGLSLYYGGADSCVCLARGRLSEMLAWLGSHSRPGNDIHDVYAARAL